MASSTQSSDPVRQLFDRRVQPKVDAAMLAIRDVCSSAMEHSFQTALERDTDPADAVTTCVAELRRLLHLTVDQALDGAPADPGQAPMVSVRAAISAISRETVRTVSKAARKHGCGGDPSGLTAALLADLRTGLHTAVEEVADALTLIVWELLDPQRDKEV